MEETLDRLNGDWWIYQLRRGHRYNTDDVLTAWTALKAVPDARRLLDLGSGVGSIGLMMLWLRRREARLVAVEVQQESVDLARKTIRYNDIDDLVDLRHGDLREGDVLMSAERFDVITANPPFLPPGSGWVSPNPQRGAARFELHGDVFDYCMVAARHLTAEGRFCLCHAAADPRPERAIEAAGLVVVERRDVVFRRGRSPRITLFLCGRQGARRELPALCVRDDSGDRTVEYMEVLRFMEIAE